MIQAFLAFFSPFWPFLMGFAAYLFAGGWLAGNVIAFRIGAIMLASYVMMRFAVASFDPGYINAVSMLVWTSAAAAIIGLRFDYGFSLIPLLVAILLVLTGTCYLWAEISGAKSVFLAPHALASDALAIAAMLLVGRGLGGELYRFFGDLGGAYWNSP